MQLGTGKGDEHAPTSPPECPITCARMFHLEFPEAYSERAECLPEGSDAEHPAGNTPIGTYINHKPRQRGVVMGIPYMPSVFFESVLMTSSLSSVLHLCIALSE